MVGRCMPSSGHGGCPGTWFMTIFGSHVHGDISNIGYTKVYEGLQALGGISSFFSRNFTSNAVRIMSGVPWGPSYEHICKNTYFCQGRFGWIPWLKRAWKTIPNGVLKVQNAWFCVNVMRISLWYHIMTSWHVDHICNILYYTVLYHIINCSIIVYYTFGYCIV